MNRILIIILFQIAGYMSYAQLFDNKWLSGYLDETRYINFTKDSTYVQLRYRTYSISSWQDTFISHSTKTNICDASGEMLIVANSNNVGNNEGFYLEGGKNFLDSIHGYNLPFGDVVYQQCLLLPKKNNSYYFLNSTLTDSTFIQANLGWPDPEYRRHPSRTNIYYSVVDMDANGGLGKVTSKKNVLFHNSLVSDGLLTAVRHANGIDWWVVFANIDTGRLYTFRFTPEGVEGPLIQDIGQPMKRVYGTATATFSPNGNMLAMGTPFTTISLFDFDRCTGLYSNYRSISSDSTDGGFAEPIPGLTGLAFSANNKYLYMCGGRDAIAQYALDSTDIASSFKLVFKKDSIIDPPDMSIFYMALAPDDKIYVSNFGGSNKFLHCITKPNLYDTACAFKTDYLQTTDWGGSYCPSNMPNYRAQASPIYTLDAGNDTVLCLGDSLVLGAEPFKLLPQTGKLDSTLTLSWQASSPWLQLSISNRFHPIIYPKKLGSYQVYLSLHDSTSIHTCTDRTDTIQIIVKDCDSITNNQPDKFYIPSIWNGADQNYTISALPANASFEVYNTIGQLIYQHKNYDNTWNTKQVSAGMYIYRLRLENGKEYKGKIFVF